MNRLSRWMGQRLARWLSAHGGAETVAASTDPALLARALQPGDVLLVEGYSRFSTVIKYLTQSTWSHAALYVGAASGRRDPRGDMLGFIEADVVDGVRAVGLDAFAGTHCRICRPVGLDAEDRQRLIATACARLGDQYDLKNIFDLLRFLIPTPPVPGPWRRRLLALGSGDPTRAICSTLIAQCFQCINYPILPRTIPGCAADILQTRHHSLFVPRDFDVSPYFEIVKPTLVTGFDYRRLVWSESAMQVAAPCP